MVVFRRFGNLAVFWRLTGLHLLWHSSEGVYSVGNGEDCAGDVEGDSKKSSDGRKKLDGIESGVSRKSAPQRRRYMRDPGSVFRQSVKVRESFEEFWNAMRTASGTLEGY